jgi:hypothetical protein
MRRTQQIQLTEEQRDELKKLVSTGTGPARVLTRARIILMAARGGKEGGNQAIERAHPGRPPRITGDIEAKLIMLACSAPPEGRSRWTLHLLADKMVELRYIDTISDVGVMKRLKKAGFVLGR